MQEDIGDEGGNDPGVEPGLGGDADDEAQWGTLEDLRSEPADREDV